MAKIYAGKRLNETDKFHFFYTPLLKENRKEYFWFFWWMGRRWYICCPKKKEGQHGDLISSTHIANVIGAWYNNINYHPETGHDPYDAAILEAENAVIAACIEAIEDEPTVDAEPVRRGEWVQDQDGYTYCSRCEKYIPTVHRYREGQDGELYEWDEEIEKTDYCPNCGARIKEEEESDPRRENRNPD